MEWEKEGEREEKNEEQNKTSTDASGLVMMMMKDLLTVSKAYENVKEGGVVVVLHNLFLQLLLNSTVDLPDTTDAKRKSDRRRNCLCVLCFLVKTLLCGDPEARVRAAD